MSDNTLPPVGATVTDADDRPWRMEYVDGLPGWFDVRGHIASDMRHADLTALWRMQQERDQLKAERDTLVEELYPWRAIKTYAGANAVGFSEFKQMLEGPALENAAKIIMDLPRTLQANKDLQARVVELEARIDAIDAACLEVCRDNHESTVGDDVDTEMGRYVCIGESGAPVIDEDEPAEVVRRLSQVWERMQERSEKAEARVAELEVDAARWRVTAPLFRVAFSDAGTRFSLAAIGHYETIGEMADDWTAQNKSIDAARAAQGGA